MGLKHNWSIMHEKENDNWKNIAGGSTETKDEFQQKETETKENLKVEFKHKEILELYQKKCKIQTSLKSLVITNYFLSKNELIQCFNLLESKETNEKEFKNFVDSHEKILQSLVSLLELGKHNSFSSTEIFKECCRFLTQHCKKIYLDEKFIIFLTMIATLEFITEKSEYENFVCEFIKQNGKFSKILNNTGQKMDNFSSNQLGFLFALVYDKSFKNWKFFHQFVFEMLISNLKKCEFSDDILMLTFFMIENSSNQENDKILQSMLENKNGINSKMVERFGFIFDKLTETQNLWILKKLEKMKGNILKIEGVYLYKFLQQVSFVQNSSQILIKFLLNFSYKENVSLFDEISGYYWFLHVHLY
jgi:hypothetical protein